jgi:hypothetical protein
MNPQERDAIRKRCLRGNYEDIANVVDHDAPALLDALEQAERLRLAAESEAACQARGVAEVNRCREELRAERDALEKAGLDALRTAERLTGELAAEKARGDRNADTVRSYGRELDAEIRKREEACAELAAEKARGEEWRQAYESATTRPYAAEAARLSRDLATQTKRAEEAEAQAKLGWQRAAEKNRAYGDSLRHLAVLREALEKVVKLDTDWASIERKYQWAQIGQWAPAVARAALAAVQQKTSGPVGKDTPTDTSAPQRVPADCGISPAFQETMANVREAYRIESGASPDWRALLERLVAMCRVCSWVFETEEYRAAVSALDATKEEK